MLDQSITTAMLQAIVSHMAAILANGVSIGL
jgi:hypothetical protein